MSIYSFIEVLKAKNVYYIIGSYRENSIMIRADVPGQRWEIEFFESGEVEVEIFKSDGEIFGEQKLNELFEKYGD